MNDPVQINLALAWAWILMGFLSGMVLGFFFRGENWLGGYASFKRRLYRLGHISFFGLGMVNLMFALTVHNFHLVGPLVQWASWAFVIGALTMPVCCLILAHVPKMHMIFSVPVVSLICGGVLVFVLILHGPKTGGTPDAALTSRLQLSTTPTK